MNSKSFLILILALFFSHAHAQEFRGIHYTPIHFDNDLDLTSHAYGILENVKSIEETNLNVQNAKIDTLIANEQTKQLRDGYVPNVSARITTTQGYNQPFLPGDARTAFPAVGVHQRVIDAPYRSDLKGSQLNEKLDSYSLNGAKQDAYLQLASAYVDILVARYRVSLAIQSYFSWTDFMDGPFAHSNPSEDDKREARLYEVKIFNAKHDLMEALGALHIKYREISAGNLSDVLIKEPLPFSSDWTLEQAVAVALENNPQYLSAKTNEAIAQNAENKTNRKNLPVLSVDAGYGRAQSLGQPGFAQEYQLHSNSYFVSATASLDLNFLDRRHEAKIRALEAQKVKNQTNTLERAIEKEIGTTFNSFTQNVEGLNKECSGLNPLQLQYDRSVKQYLDKNDMRLQDLLRYRSDLFQTADGVIVRFGRMILDSFLLYQKLGLMTEEKLLNVEYAGARETPFGNQSQIFLNPADFHTPDPSPLARLLGRCPGTQRR